MGVGGEEGINFFSIVVKHHFNVFSVREFFLVFSQPPPNLVPRVLFVWPRAEENPGKGCENNPQFVDYFVTWYV